MKAAYGWAGAVAAAAVAAGTWAWFESGSGPVPVLIVAAAGVPLAALLLAWGRLGGTLPGPALIGGGTIGVIVALISHGAVLAFAYAFFLGFADRASDLLDRLRLDPEWSSALGSPWTVLLLVELAVVAPLTEEIGKALGARVFRPSNRRAAFLAGVAAGTGFAIVENLAYGVGQGFLGVPWEAILLGRMMGAAVHPLASGLVVLGWWEWRTEGNARALASRFFSGVGVHALWNGSLVVLGVTATAFDSAGRFGTYTLVSLSYTAVLGALAAAGLWRATASVADDRPRILAFDSGDARVVGSWAVLAATFMVPIAMLVLGYPGFVAGG